jgi:hypothetical protein
MSQRKKMTKTKTEKNHKVMFEFPNKASRDSFLAWFSDGGGESQFLDGEALSAHEDDRKPIIEFDFKDAFWGFDPKKHGNTKVVKALNK